MKLMLQNTSHGLIPLYDADYEEKKRLKIGEVYECNIKVMRNYKFHQKYFALLDCAYSLQNEARIKELYPTKENFRDTVQKASGFFELSWDEIDKRWDKKSKSIRFDKVDNLEFEEIYKNVRHVIDTVFCSHISIEDFEKYLSNF